MPDNPLTPRGWPPPPQATLTVLVPDPWGLGRISCPPEQIRETVEDLREIFGSQVPGIITIPVNGCVVLRDFSQY